METSTMIIKDSIPIPKAARRRWINQQVFVGVSEDTIIVKRVEPPTWEELIPKLKAAGKSLSPKDLRSAVAWARRRP